MSKPSEIESAGGRLAPSEKEADASSIAWKRDYKGCTITIFGSQRFGWNTQIDKREPIILGYTRARAIKYSKQLIDAEQAKWHTRSVGGTLHGIQLLQVKLYQGRSLSIAHFRLAFQRTGGEANILAFPSGVYYCLESQS